MQPAQERHGPFSLQKVLEDEYVALHAHPLPPQKPDRPADERLAALYRQIRTHAPRRAALCLSGGGIRSATFGLGVLQGLAKRSLLTRFDYLSTVSGGGYIGSWLTAWIHRHPDGLAGVANELACQATDHRAPEPAPITWLRQYSNYLSPKLGLMSVDSWTLLGTYLRNLTLNWLVLVPLLITALLAPRLMLSLVRWNLSELGLPASLAGWALGLGLLSAAIGLSYFHLYRPGLDRLRALDLRKQADDRPPQSIWKPFERQQWFLIVGFSPLLLATLLVTTAYAWYKNDGGQLAGLAWGSLGSRNTFLVGGALVHGAGWLLAALLLRRWRDMSRWQEFGRWLPVEFLVILWSGAVGGLLLWSVLAETPALRVGEFAEWYACFAFPGILAMFLLTATLFVGVASRYTDDHDREWWGRAGAWILIAATAWAGIASLVVFGPGLLYLLPPTIAASVGGLSGLISLVLGFSAKTSATAKTKPSLADLVLDRAARLAAPLFIACLLALLSVLTSRLLNGLASVRGPQPALSAGTGLLVPPDPWGHATILHGSQPWLLIGLALSLTAWAFAMSLVININKFSLHSIYRNRLIRAYLGASRGKERRRNLFTDFDPDDNVQLCHLAPPGRPVQKPFHVLNIALNLVRAENLAWQQRKAQSFTASPLYCGSWNQDLGYRRADEYGKNSQIGKAISLGTALAVSGAAASPNMGYHSAPAVTFLLALFNVRLGWWLGNPGAAGATTFHRSCPRIAIRPLLAELFGLTDAGNPYVYLSDGGHFENLGLYEMVLRRCQYIVVSDASCDQDQSFTDLGNAVRKIRIDLGVDIEIHPGLLHRKDGSRTSEGHYALGLIRYDRTSKPGLLIYVKPSLTGNEPADVTEYANRHAEFPHEPTADQFFDESQFESYRALGVHIAEKVFSDSVGNPASEAERLFAEFLAGSPA